jgi:hypothetical protein
MNLCMATETALGRRSQIVVPWYAQRIEDMAITHGDLRNERMNHTNVLHQSQLRAITPTSPTSH